jgi:hypothetical protein
MLTSGWLRPLSCDIFPGLLALEPSLASPYAAPLNAVVVSQACILGDIGCTTMLLPCCAML